MNESLPFVKRSIYSIYVKRLLDILISGMAILILSPIFIIVAILELVFHGRPILYSQERPGLDGKLFTMYKFRSMNSETDKNGKLLPGEQRITKFGRFIRRFSLDELPELFCIFSGKMSIIGPRPLLPEYLELYSERHKMRHSVKPGLACVPIKKMDSWTWNDQFENDIYYVENVSFILDVKMFMAVVRETICGSNYRVNDTREEYTGSNLNSNAK